MFEPKKSIQTLIWSKRVSSFKLISLCLALNFNRISSGMSRIVFADLGKVVISLFIVEVLLQIFVQGLIYTTIYPRARTNMSVDLRASFS